MHLKKILNKKMLLFLFQKILNKEDLFVPMLVVSHYRKTMKGFIENIKFRNLMADIVEVKRKEIEDSDFKTF